MNIYFCRCILLSGCILLAGCYRQEESQLTPDFLTLQKASFEELQLKTQAHVENWGLGSSDRWDLSQDTGELAFTFADGTKAVAPAQIVGTYNSEERTWLWAWANPSVNEELRKDALKVREYGEQHRIERLTKAKWEGTEADAWEMAALAVKLCGEQGAYRGPAGSTYLFIAFGEVKLSKK